MKCRLVYAKVSSVIKRVNAERTDEMDELGKRIVMTLSSRELWLKNRYILLLDGDECEYYSVLVTTESGKLHFDEYVKDISRNESKAKDILRMLCRNKVSASSLLYVLQDNSII